MEAPLFVSMTGRNSENHLIKVIAFFFMVVEVILGRILLVTFIAIFLFISV
jgi:hypothetical protein